MTWWRIQGEENRIFVGLGFHEGISVAKRAERDLNWENFDVLDGFMTLWFVDLRGV